MNTLKIPQLVLFWGCIVLNASAESVLIHNVSVVSPEAGGSISVRNVFIEDGRIKTVSDKKMSADLNIQGKGKYLTPGLIDSHVHLEGIPGIMPAHAKKHSKMVAQAKAQIPRSYLYFGFTTVVDLLSNKPFIDAWNEQTIRPDAHFCIGAPIANGYPLAWLPEEQRFSGDNAQYMLYDPRQQKNIPKHIDPSQHSPKVVVSKIKDAGALCVKSFYESGFGRLKNLPNPTQEMMRELIDTAHEQGMPVFMHGNSQAAHEFAADAGVDIIAHGMWHWRDKKAKSPSEDIDALVNKIVKDQIAYQPTIQVIIGEQELFNDKYFDMPEFQHVAPKSLIAWYQSTEGHWMRREMAENMGEKTDEITYEKIQESYAPLVKRLNKLVALLASKNAQLIFGSDTPSGPFYTQFPGLNGRLEIQRLAEAGVPLDQILNSLTVDNARVLGLENELGTIEPGKVANLLILDKNPLTNINAYDSIDAVILHGVVHDRASLSAL